MWLAITLRDTLSEMITLLWQQGKDVMSHNDPVTAMSLSQCRALTDSWKSSRDLIKSICSVITRSFPSSCIQLWKQPYRRTPNSWFTEGLISPFCTVQIDSPQRSRSSVGTVSKCNLDQQGPGKKQQPEDLHWSRHKVSRCLECLNTVISIRENLIHLSPTERKSK